MKKTYTKPDIMFDSFSLCSSIAAGCARPIGNQSQGNCPLMVSGNPHFLSSVTVCWTVIEDGSPQYDGICYHVPTDSTNLFNS